MKIKKYFKYLLFLIALLIGLSASAHAITAVTPAKSAINLVTDTLYIVDNSVPQIKVLSRNTIGWNTGGSPITLPAGSKCYGLAVSPNGDTLYISISNGSNSAIEAHELNVSTGRPNGTVHQMTGAYWATVSSPAGMAVGGNDRLFVADQGIGRMLIFDTSNYTYVKAVTTQIAGKTNLYDIAVTSTSATSYKVYLSRKVLAGEIYVYTYGNVNDTIVYEKVLDTDLVYPTYLKFNNDRLYVAVNGYDDVVVKAYNTSDESLIGNVTADVSGSYGWNAFDVGADGTILAFKKAQNAAETSTKLYRINTASIPGAGTEVADIIRSDNIAVRTDNLYAGIGNSPDGNFEFKSLAPGNSPPNSPTNLVQYELDETTIINKGEEAAGNTIVLSFTVSDPDPQDMITPIVVYAPVGTGPIIEVSIDPVPSGTTVMITLEALADGEYEWYAAANDGVSMNIATAYGGDGMGNGGIGTADFVINTSAGEFQITETSPVDQATDVPLNAPIVIKFNREVNIGTFNLNINPAVNFEGAVWSAGNTYVALPHTALFDTGTQYTFEVTAQDMQANSLTGQTSFTFTTSSNPDDLAPYIVETTPVADATGVTLAQSIIVRFSQEMNASTFSGSITSGNDPTGWRPAEWNATDTQVTLVHDNPFAQNTAYTYQVDSTTAGSNGLALIPGLVPNPFSFTTGTDIGDPIVNIEVTRDGDNPGDGITITWDTLPPGLGVDVYKLTCPTDVDGNYTSYFTTTAASWTLEQANVTIGSITIQNQVGQGTAEYYKLIPTGNTLQDSDLETNVAGKFDIHVEEGMNLLSLPLIPTSGTSISEIIGTQVAGSANGIRDESDEVWKYNPSEPSKYEYAWLVEGSGDPQLDDKWFTPVGQESTLTIGADEGFWLQVKAGNPTSWITVIGMVSETGRSISTNTGMNMIGSAFPVPVVLASSGLNDPLTGSANGIRDESDEVWKYNPSEPSKYEYAWLVEGSGDPQLDDKWFTPVGQESTIAFMPGKGNWIQVKNTGFNWTYIKPY